MYGTQIFKRRFKRRRARDEKAQERNTKKRTQRQEVTSRKQAIAIGLSEARSKGKKVPRKRRL